jgi:hypothetical protein
LLPFCDTVSSMREGTTAIGFVAVFWTQSLAELVVIHKYLLTD